MITDTNNTDENIWYRLCKLSGTLDFWDNEGEDIYTDEDGESIEAFE